LSADEDIKQCASIFAAGIPPNPRKIKCILRAFLSRSAFLQKPFDLEELTTAVGRLLAAGPKEISS
jgi:hypothetical protein